MQRRIIYEVLEEEKNTKDIDYDEVFLIFEFEKQSYGKHLQNFVIRNLQINLLAL